MKRADADEFDIIDVIRYLSASDDPIENGHVIADPEAPRFQAFVEGGPRNMVGSLMHNPFGRLKLVNMRDVAEMN